MTHFLQQLGEFSETKLISTCRQEKERGEGMVSNLGQGNEIR